jgi:phenylpyruvate tautomerase PptA (4-oxalocrotonate tautomerase family)
MPHLQFEVNFSPTSEEKRRFAAAVVRRFSEIMDTGTDHIAVTLRCFAPEDLTFGRAAPSGGRTAFVNADIRLGRTRDQKRRLALAYIDELAATFGVAREAVYVILTEHDGEHFQLSDRVLPSWSAGEDPLADAPRRRAPRVSAKTKRSPPRGRRKPGRR